MEKEENAKLIEKNSDSLRLSSETAQELDDSKEKELLKKVEAALFISARFLTLQDLVMLTDINPLMLKELIEKLREKYNEDSAIEIIEKKDLWKMDVRQEYVDMINKLATGSVEFSKAEQETLAVIAYKQPVKQSVIIKIRGNKAYDHIKHFIDIGLVVSKKLGHTNELKLSDEFFEYFHLVDKDEIPDGFDFSSIKKTENSDERKKSDEEDFVPDEVSNEIKETAENKEPVGEENISQEEVNNKLSKGDE